MQRIMNPDRTLRFEPGRQAFGGTGRATFEKPAAVRTFSFSRPAAVGTFATRPYSGAGNFRTRAAAGADRQGLNAVSRSRADGITGRGPFAARALPVRADPAATRTFATRAATAGGAAPRRFAVPGKRQEALDEQSRARPMTIEEVRELLNKNR